MPCLGHSGVLHLEANSAAVVRGGCLAVVRLTYDEPAAIVGVNQSSLGIGCGGLDAHGPKQGIVELLRPFDVVAADQNVGKHAVPSWLASRRLAHQGRVHMWVLCQVIETPKVGISVSACPIYGANLSDHHPQIRGSRGKTHA